MYEKIIMGKIGYDRYEICRYTRIKIIRAKKRREEKSKREKQRTESNSLVADYESECTKKAGLID